MPSVRKLVLLFLLCAATVCAHVGSPDIYLDGKAGPYQLFVTIRPPLVIPGVAQIEVRCETPGVKQIRAVPLALTGDGATFAPLPDQLHVSPQDAQFFTGSLWMMADGSWQIRLTVDGAGGPGVLAIPVPAIALATRKMQWQLSATLSILGLLLVGGIVAISGASVREVRLDPGMEPDSARIKRGRIAMAIAFVLVAAVLWGGKTWWDNEASTFRDRVYKPLQMAVTLDQTAPVPTLHLKLIEPGWMIAPPPRVITRLVFRRKLDDLIPDHDHIIHLYAIREPGLDVVYHLHPDLSEPGEFRLTLPDMPAGAYRLYADIVHEDGFAETMTAHLNLPAIKGRALAGYDAATQSSSWQQISASTNSFTLPDGYRMEWVRDATPLRARQGIPFRFRLLTSAGQAVPDMALYMGMFGHAAIVKTDGTVFAHIHPNGTVAMAALMMAQNSQTSTRDMSMPAMNHESMSNMRMNLPNEVAFPYGFPSAGHYRIFVQMKHGQTVETGVFDAIVGD